MNDGRMIRSAAMYLLLAVVVAVFGRMLTAEPVAWDEAATLRSISLVHNEGLNAHHDPLQRPLPLLLLSSVDLFGHGSLFLYHLFSLLAHGMNILLFYRLMRHAGCGSWASLLASSMFALHPFIAPVVVSVTEFPVVLSTTIVLMFLSVMWSDRLRPSFRIITGSALALLFHCTVPGGAILPVAWWSADRLAGKSTGTAERNFRKALWIPAVISMVVSFAPWRNVLHDSVDFLRFGVFDGLFRLIVPMTSAGIVPLSAVIERTTVAGIPMLPFLVPFLCAAAVVLSRRWSGVPVFFTGFVLLSTPLVRWTAGGEWVLNNSSYYLSSLFFFAVVAVQVVRGMEDHLSRDIFRRTAVITLVLITAILTVLCHASVGIRTTNGNFWRWMSGTYAENETVMLRYGSYRLSRYEVEEAVSIFTAVVDRHPTSSAAYDHRGVAALTRYDMEGAITDLRTAIHLDPLSAIAEYDLANAFSVMEQWDSVIVHSTRALSLQPDLKEAYNNRGNARARRSGFVQAFADYASALRIDPAYADAWGNRALIHLERGNAVEAYRDMKVRASIEKQRFPAQVQCALTAFLAADSAGVVQYWRTGWNLDSSNAKLYLESVLPTFIHRPDEIARFYRITGDQTGKSFQEKKTMDR